MVQVLLLVSFAAIYAGDALHASTRREPSPYASAALLGGLAILWAMMQVVAVRSGRRLDLLGDGAAYNAAHVWLGRARVAGVACFAYCVLGLGWLDAVRSAMGDWPGLDELAALAPVPVFMAALWWTAEPLERRLRDALLWRDLHEGRSLAMPMTRWEGVWSQVRHQMLIVLVPIALLMTWAEAGPALLGVMDPARSWPAWSREAWQWAGVVALVGLAPAIIRRLWDTVEIGPGDLRERILAVCRAHRVRVRGPYLWRTRGVMANGAILGLFYPFRYVLFTDALLEGLTEPQVEGVVAHEAAHVRLRHLLWLGVGVVASVMTASAAVSLGLGAWPGPVSDGVVLAIGAGLPLVAGLLAFGAISRRFEWQADAFAARHLTVTADPAAAAVSAAAAEIMASTLHRVAGINGVSPTRFSWRHGSIAERQRRLRTLAGTDLRTIPIDRQVRWIKRASLLVLGLVAAAAVVFDL